MSREFEQINREIKVRVEALEQKRKAFNEMQPRFDAAIAEHKKIEAHFQKLKSECADPSDVPKDAVMKIVNSYNTIADTRIKLNDLSWDIGNLEHQLKHLEELKKARTWVSAKPTPKPVITPVVTKPEQKPKGLFQLAKEMAKKAVEPVRMKR